MKRLLILTLLLPVLAVATPPVQHADGAFMCLILPCCQ